MPISEVPGGTMHPGDSDVAVSFDEVNDKPLPGEIIDAVTDSKDDSRSSW